MYWKEFKEYEKLTALEGEQYAYFKKKKNLLQVGEWLYLRTPACV